MLCRGAPAPGAASCADLVVAGLRPLEQLKTALELGRKADTVVGQALAWAALLNGLAVPLVAGCLWAPGHVRLTPRLAGGLTCLSILGAAAASLSLRSWKPPQKVA
jgi:cation transport ATPase